MTLFLSISGDAVSVPLAIYDLPHREQGRKENIMKKIAVNFVYLLIVFLMGMTVAWGLMDGAAEVQEIRELEAQLNGCRSGNFCAVTTQDEQFRFLTISRRDK